MPCSGTIGTYLGRERKKKEKTKEKKKRSAAFRSRSHLRTYVLPFESPTSTGDIRSVLRFSFDGGGGGGFGIP